MRVNLGCGFKPLDGWLNLDKNPADDSIMYCDIEDVLPLADDSCEEILLDNVVEHLRDIPKLIRELDRCLMSGGTVKIVTPHFTSAASWRDPTHTQHLSYFSFDYLNSGHRKNYLAASLFVKEKRLSFPGGMMGLIGRALFRLSADAWEKKWCFLFRASTLTVVLAKPDIQYE